MTHKTALSLALFAAFGMTACSVDAPTRDNFDYSFQDEMPDGLVSGELGFASSTYTSEIAIRFRDGMHGLDSVHSDAAAAFVNVESVSIRKDGEWTVVRDQPVELDLFDLVDGDVARLGQGPVARGQYDAVLIELGKTYVVDVEGDTHPVGMPGSVLTIEGEYRLDDDERTELYVNFGALRTLDLDKDGNWTADPNVTFAAVYEDGGGSHE